MNVCSLNVNGLNEERIEELNIFLKTDKPEIVFLQETKRRCDQINNKLIFPNYKTYAAERDGTTKQGGGLCTIVRSDINLTPCNPELKDTQKWIEKERQWFLLETPHMKIGIVNVYMACERSDTDDYKKWNRQLRDVLISESEMLNRDGFKVIMTGMAIVINYKTHNFQNEKSL